jgi:glycosyltransferase involved in cell wall biosynthesis
MTIRFTIIVPTRERSGTLASCIKNLLQQDYDNYEILVSDNFSQDQTHDLVTSFSSPLIRYINTGKRISMTHNWEFALNQVDSGWVLFIGDDDGLMQGALRTLNNVIQLTSCEALSASSCDFWWPGHFPLRPDGELTMPMPVKNFYEIRNSAFMLDLVMRGEVAYRELPWLYHGGAASVDLLKKLRTADGKFFQSINPDIYSAVSIALGTQTYVKVNIPIAINGASKFSGGVSYMQGNKDEPTTPSSIFLKEDNIPFDSRLILGKSLQLFVYECYLKANHLYKMSSYSLINQLKIALITAPTNYFPVLLADCKLMAISNTLSFPRISEIIFFRLIYKSKFFLKSIFMRPTITVSASKLGAWDIHLAAIAVNNIYLFFWTLAYKNSILIRLGFFIFLFFIFLNKFLKKINKKIKAPFMQALTKL